eukprot:1299943-Alexandrium_andersonii.AAC.1
MHAYAPKCHAIRSRADAVDRAACKACVAKCVAKSSPSCQCVWRVRSLWWFSSLGLAGEAWL